MRPSILISVLLSLSGLAFNLQANGLEVANPSASVSVHSHFLDTDQDLDQNHALPPPADTSSMLASLSAQTPEPCTPFCVNPVELSEGVRTIDERGVLKFIKARQDHGRGLIVDTRASNWYQRSTIPGSINIPSTLFEKTADEAELAQVFERLGVKARQKVSPLKRVFESVGMFNGKLKTEHWDFTNAEDIVLWCNDPWCGQSPRAIKALLSHGYPADRLYYYRGGIKTWESRGLATVVPVVDRFAAK